MTYSDFIAICTAKELKIQYKLRQETESSDKYYELTARENGDIYLCRINSTDNASEVSDFETNYKDTSNKPLMLRDDFGNPIYAPTLEDVFGLYPKKKSYRHTVNLGQINIFDIAITTEQRIQGGEYWIKDTDVDYVSYDDYVEFSVVDKNNVLGLFSLYGLDPSTGSTDILELSKFIINDYVRVGSSTGGYYKQCFEGIKGTSLVYAGLFYRIMYHSEYTPSTGDPTSIVLKSRLFYYE